MNILEQIIADKRIEIASRKQELALELLQQQACCVEPRPDFLSALRSVPMGLIAEVKRRSPSAGMIRDPFDPSGIALEYEASGAHAISCLIDADAQPPGCTRIFAWRSGCASSSKASATPSRPL